MQSKLLTPCLEWPLKLHVRDFELRWQKIKSIFANIISFHHTGTILHHKVQTIRQEVIRQKKSVKTKKAYQKRLYHPNMMS